MRGQAESLRPAQQGSEPRTSPALPTPVGVMRAALPVASILEAVGRAEAALHEGPRRHEGPPLEARGLLCPSRSPLWPRGPRRALTSHLLPRCQRGVLTHALTLPFLPTSPPQQQGPVILPLCGHLSPTAALSCSL